MPCMRLVASTVGVCEGAEKGKGELEEFADPKKREGWIRDKGMQVFSLFHPDQAHWVVDLFVESPIDFSELQQRSVVKEIEGVSVPIASIDDLISMKRLAGRDIDQSDIRHLEQIKEMPDDYA